MNRRGTPTQWFRNTFPSSCAWGLHGASADNVFLRMFHSVPGAKTPDTQEATSCATSSWQLAQKALWRSLEGFELRLCSKKGPCPNNTGQVLQNFFVHDSVGWSSEKLKVLLWLGFAMLCQASPCFALLWFVMVCLGHAAPLTRSSALHDFSL